MTDYVFNRNGGKTTPTMNPTLWTRRSFLCTTAAAAMAGISQAAPAPPRKKIALIGTVVRKHSHAQHFLDRLALGYTWGGRWQQPRVDLASLYIDQFPEGDLARSRAKRYNLKLSASIADALTLGTGKLAVDGVVIIGEHGDYPRNEIGQTLYPRYEFFKQIVKVFEANGRSVPVFNDKHLSTDWTKCAEMVADASRLGFAFFAGSSLPVTRRLPAIDMPWGTPLRRECLRRLRRRGQLRFSRTRNRAVHVRTAARRRSRNQERAGLARGENVGARGAVWRRRSDSSYRRSHAVTICQSRTDSRLRP